MKIYIRFAHRQSATNNSVRINKQKKQTTKTKNADKADKAETKNRKSKTKANII